MNMHTHTVAGCDFFVCCYFFYFIFFVWLVISSCTEVFWSHVHYTHKLFSWCCSASKHHDGEWHKNIMAQRLRVVVSFQKWNCDWKLVSLNPWSPNGAPVYVSVTNSWLFKFIKSLNTFKNVKNKRLLNLESWNRGTLVENASKISNGKIIRVKMKCFSAIVS